LIAEPKCDNTPTRLTPRVIATRRRAECIVHHDALLLPHHFRGSRAFFVKGKTR
jgi:hypothetical protein